MEVSSTREPSLSETRSFPGQYKSLEKIGDFVRKFAKTAGFGSLAIYSIEMAVDEACSNIIEHAYGGEGVGDIRCTCSVNDKALTITLRDQGKSFNPADIPPPNLSSNLDDRQAHGLGFYFIQKWMDEVYMTSNGPENILTLVKHK